MQEAEFRAWIAKKSDSPSTQNTRVQDAKRVEAHYGDLDEAYDADGLEGIKAELAYSKADERAGRENPARFPIDGNLYMRSRGRLSSECHSHLTDRRWLYSPLGPGTKR